MSNLKDSFFETRGFSSAADYMDFIRIHEEVHVLLKEPTSPQGGHAGGHGGVWIDVFNRYPGADNTVARSITFTLTSFLTDTVENKTFARLLNAGKFSGVSSAEEFSKIPQAILDLLPATQRNKESINSKRLLEFLEFRQTSLSGIVANAISRWKEDYKLSHPGQPVPEPTLGDLAKSDILTRKDGRDTLHATIEQIWRNDFGAILGRAGENLLEGFTNLDGGQLGIALGSVLGKRVTSNPFGQIVASGTFSTVLGAVGEFIDTRAFHGTNSTHILDAGVEGFGKTLLNNIKGAGIGALSSYLTAELVSAIGVNGVPGEVANSLGGAVVTQILTNLEHVGEVIRNAEGTVIGHRTLFDNIGPGLIANAAASYLGSKLASAIYKPDTVGGQIGSAVGAAYGSFVAGNILAISGVNPVSFAAAVVAVALWTVLGGLIGSIFGGTPRSGADASWDAAKGEFVVANAYARKGGSKEAAQQLASIVATNLNAVLVASGATLLDPARVQTGNYGMRKKEYTYRPTSTRDEGAITARFSGKDGAEKLTTHGSYLGIASMLEQLAGGDVYIKRAIGAVLANSGGNPNGNGVGAAGQFSMTTLSGAIATATDYGLYVQNAPAINALIAADAQTGFSTGWVVTLAQAIDLGLNRRAATDWTGGYVTFLDEAIDGRIDRSSLLPVQLAMVIEESTGARLWEVIGTDGKRIGFVHDTIETGSQTDIVATTANDIIDLRAGSLVNQIGYTVDHRLNDDIAVSGADFIAKSATLNLAAGARSATGSVVTIADSLVEAGERFDVALSNADGVKIVGPAAAVMVVAADALPTLMVGRSYAAEGDGYAVFHIGLSRAATTAVTLDLALKPGSATEGVDYVAGLEVSADGVSGWTSATSVTLAPGAKSYFVRVAVIADNGINDAGQPTNVEANESLTLTATVTAGASALANGTAPVSGQGTIIDGTSATPFAWIDDQVVHEGSTAELWIHRTGTAPDAASITYTTSDRTRLDIAVAATVDGGAGDDTIYASNLGDNLFGGAGNDTLYGGRLDDWLLGGEGDDVLDAGTADQATLGGDGNYLSGGTGNDTLRGREGSDWLEGGDGTDTLTGGAGDDILAGGGGENDALYGGTGSDQYIVRRGDGLDIVEEDASGAPPPSGSGDAIAQRIAKIEAWKANPNAVGALRPDWIGTSAGVQAGAVSGGEDAIVFGGGIGIGDIRLQRSGTASAQGNDLIVMVMTTTGDVESFSGTQVTIRDWFTNPFKRVEWLRFADGNEIRIGDITSFVIGGSGDDVLIGTQGNDFVYGGAGDDRLFLLAGDDVGNGGVGNDMVVGDAGRDLLIGSAGNDQLIGGAGIDAITGDAGADDIYGGADNDIVAGGRGDGDLIAGGAGNDTFRYTRGDGRDTYIDEFADYWAVAWTAAGGWNNAAGFTYNQVTGEVTGPGGVVIRKNVGTAAEPEFAWLGRYDYDSGTQTLKVFAAPENAPTLVANAGIDTIEFAPGINLQDVILMRAGNGKDLVLALSGENEELGNTEAAPDSITIKDWYLAPGQIEKLAFYQTGILDIAPASMSLIAGTDGADGTGTTPLQGTSVSDWITGAAGDDVIAGGFGNDILAGNSGFDTLRGEAGDDVLYGGAGNDILDGGAGKDVLVGGAGQNAASYASAATAVRAQLSASWANSGDALGDEYTGIADLTGGSGGDVLGGDSGENILAGGAGGDTLQGNAGNDTYAWNVGDGADTIIEGSFVVEEAVTAAGALASGYTVSIWEKTGTISGINGNAYWRLQLKGPDGTVVYDSSNFSYAPTATPAVPSPAAYVVSGWLGGFARTSGQQVTRSRFDAAADGGNDEIEFGANISLSDLSFLVVGNDLMIRYGGSGASQLTIREQRGTNAGTVVETLKLADGFAVSLKNVWSAWTEPLEGTQEDDYLTGRWGAYADTLLGGDGNDVLVGYAGNDLLYGGSGDDTFEAGTGADLMDGGTNSPSSAGADAGDTARYVRSAAAVIVDLNLTTAQGGATNADSVGDVLLGIENVVGSAFDDTLTGDGNDNRLFGLDGIDTLRGGGGADVLVGDAGNDLLYGDAGGDTVSGGDGDDALYGGSEKDLLDGGAGNDGLYGEAGDDQLNGALGNDTIDGGEGNDVLGGGDGNDTLLGGTGNDKLVGGAGNDTLSDAAGDEVYSFERFSGQDILTDRDGTNIITFDASVTYDKVWLTRVGNDLRVAVIGGDTAVTVTDFFLPADNSRVHSIVTGTHTIFLDHPESLQLVAAMTAATTTPAATPTALPASIAPLLASWWHVGGKAAPKAPAAPRTAALSEDGSLNLDGTWGIVDHDQNIASFRLKEGSGPIKGTITGFDPLTGALTYTPFADANGSDSFVVIATDADGQAVELPVNLTITPVNDAPGGLHVAGDGVLEIVENAPGSGTADGKRIGQFTAADPEGDIITYTLADNAGGRFTIDGATGELRVGNASLLDRETGASHTIRVVARDSHGAETSSTFTVTVTGFNEAPFAPQLDGARGIASEFVSGVTAPNDNSFVAKFKLSDPDLDGSLALIFAIDGTGNPGNYFKIVGNQVQFAAEPDFEALAAAGYSISDGDGDGFGEVTLTGKVQASDGTLPSLASTGFSVRIEDVNQQHTAINANGLAMSIEERDRLAADAPPRQLVVLGTLGTDDPDRADQPTGKYNWTVFEGASTVASTRFVVDESNRLVLRAGESLDFETDGASITLRVRATDKSSSPLSLERNLTFAIADQIDILDGTAGADTLYGTVGRDLLRGLGGDDTLYGLAGADELDGGAGDDTLYGGEGDDRLSGGSNKDTLIGEAGNDVLLGEDGDDTLQGGAGDDTLEGGAGNEGERVGGTQYWRGFVQTGLFGGDGNDILNGGDGDDFLDGGLGADQLNGGAGFDGVTYAGSAAGVSVNLAANQGAGGNAQGDTFSGIELVQGSNHGDAITGSASGNVIYGGAGNDTIWGGAGADFLFGGDGDDWIDAEAGNDYLDGGAGNDTLRGGIDNDIYFIGRNRGNDQIQNFDPTGSNFDHIAFDGSILYTDIWFDRVDGAGVISASGNHLRMTILGTTGAEGSVLVENWFTIPDHTLPENYFKIDLISDGDARAAIPVNVDALVDLMAALPAGTRPTTQAQMAALRSGNASFANALEDHWGHLSAPKISNTISISGIEPLDNGLQTISFQVRAWFEDEQGLGVVIPASNIDLVLDVADEYALSNYVTAVDYGTPDANGYRTVTLTLAPDASTPAGFTVPLLLRAQIRGTTRTALDPGGIALTIAPTADTPYLTQLVGTAGNAGSYLPIYISAMSSDVDGSEITDILISAPPAGYAFTNAVGQAIGTFDGTWWRFSAEQAANLRLRVPAGSAQDITLTVVPRAIEGSSIRNGAATPLTIKINGAPTALTLRGMGLSPAPRINEYVPGVSATNGVQVGTVVPTDPDSVELSVIPTGVAQLPLGGWGEERIITAIGPAGNPVQVLETGQGATMDAGGGVHWVAGGTADTSRAYKFTIFFKPENNLNHHLYFGTYGNVLDASTGVANSNPYFWYGNSASLVQDRWYRIEGYVLPEGSPPIGNETYGGVFDTVTGEKVANTFTYRFGAGGSETGARFFSYYGSMSGYSAQWYQPIVEKLEYTYALEDSAGGRFSINATTGIVTANGTAFDRETAASHAITVRVTDSGGLSKTQTFTIAVDNVNEAPNAPGGGATTWSFFDETGNGGHPASGGATVVSFALSDIDGTTPTLQFGSNGNPGGWFTIVGNQVRLAEGFNFNFETFRAQGYSIYDWNGDGRLEAHIANVYLKAWDGALPSSETLLQVFISDVNERPNNLTLVASTVYSETLNGEAPQSGKVIASFGMSDPDGTTPNLVILGGNAYGWFQTVGNQLAFTSANFSADWFRAYKGQYGTDADFYYDTDGDGLKEIRVTRLTLAAQDASGALSDSFTYDVLIEDQNEAPTWAGIPFTFNLNENTSWYQYVGSVWGTDIDGPPSELRYLFANWDWYHDANLGKQVSRSPDQRFVVTYDGLVYVNGSQNIDAELPLSTLSYSTLIYDRALGANTAYQYGTLNINIINQNEDFALRDASGSRAEGSYSPYPSPLEDPNSYFDMRALMLTNTEGDAIRWSFSDGSMTSGIWSIEGSTGRVYLTSPYVDYESLVEVYEWQRQWVQVGTDPWDGTPIYEEQDVYVYMGRDPSRATQTLAVRATDAGGIAHTANFTVTINDVNEGPVFGYTPRFIVRDDQSNGYLGTLFGYDPETGAGASSYSISLVSFEEQFLSQGGSEDIDNTGNPTVSVAWNNGRLSFNTPGDGEWEGGIRNHPTYHIRMSYQLVYRMQATMTDASGISSTQPFEIIFLKHGQSNVLPLILDLDGDGVEMVDADTSSVRFDMNEDGIADRTGWVGADDGLLVLDRNGNGVIDDARELSFAKDDEQAVTDLEGLRAWDSNRNGLLDGGDTDFARFQIWRDINQNGISEASELFSLTSLGIKSLNLTLNLTNQELVSDRNVLFATSEFHRTDGTTGVIGDVSFAFDPEDPPEAVAPPIVLDLDGNGAALVSLADSKTRFDMNGDGVADKTGWITTGDALLALDRNGNSTVDGIDEISFVKDKAGAKTDLEGLAAFDSNADGKLDGSDARFVEFRAWRDANSNGVTDAGELLSLAQAGIVSISLTGAATGETAATGNNIVYNTGSFVRATGANGMLLDVGLAFKAMPKLPEIEFQSSDWSGKARNYDIGASVGAARVTPRHAKGVLSAEAGQIAPAAILTFDDRTYGLLSTILVDLDGDGLEARRANRAAAGFDMNGDGSLDNTGWVSGGDGFLVIDRDGDGAITHASEISFLSEKDGATSAWDGLSVLDNNRDGKVDGRDARFGALKIWADRNGDGISQADELKSLADMGIAEIGLRTAPSSDSAKVGDNLPLSTATFKWSNGVTATIGNVALAFEPATKSGGSDVTPEEQTPAETAAALAASRLVQAMNGFGAGSSEGSLSSRWTERQANFDWLAAKVA